MSFSGITPPPQPSTESLFDMNMPRTNQIHFNSIQVPLLNMSQYQQPWLPSTSIQQSLLIQQQQQQHIQQLQNQIDSNKNQILSQMQQSNSLSSSVAFYPTAINTAHKPDRFSTEYSNLFPNPSDISILNMQHSSLGTFSLTNQINNNFNKFNNLLLNESFENGSLYDDSFKLSLNNTLNNQRTKTIDIEEDEDNYFSFHQQEELNEDEIEDADEIELKFLKKNKKLNLDSQNINSHHRNILKFYEEEEKNIELEIRQDKELLSVLTQEAKLTRQLSVEQLMHFSHQYQFQKIKKNIENFDQDQDDTDLAVGFQHNLKAIF